MELVSLSGSQSWSAESWSVELVGGELVCRVSQPRRVGKRRVGKLVRLAELVGRSTSQSCSIETWSAGGPFLNRPWAYFGYPVLEYSTRCISYVCQYQVSHI
jgi:hypothetical protein